MENVDGRPPGRPLFLQPPCSPVEERDEDPGEDVPGRTRPRTPQRYARPAPRRGSCLTVIPDRITPDLGAPPAEVRGDRLRQGLPSADLTEIFQAYTARSVTRSGQVGGGRPQPEALEQCGAWWRMISSRS